MRTGKPKFKQGRLLLLDQFLGCFRGCFMFDYRVMRVVLFTMLLGGSLSLAATASAEVISFDNADQPAYASGWTNLSNGASNTTVLGPWVFGGNAVSGTSAMIASSTTLGTSGTIDVNGKSFELSDTTSTGSYIDVFRFILGDLKVGQTLSLDMQVNFRGGFKGINIRGVDDDTSLFKFEVGNSGGGDDYVVSNAATGNGSVGNAYSADTRFNIALEQSSPSGGAWTVTRTGGITSTSLGTYAGQVSSFQLYTFLAGSSDQNAIFYNNIQVVPEPATISTLLAAALLGLPWLRRQVSRGYGG